MENLIKIQSELKSPKSQFNSFGKYKYRNCEDVLEAVKPLLAKYGCTLTISDEILEVGGMIYVQANATFRDIDDDVTVSAQAGIDPNRKGMDIAQSFGSSSSYARKYALNGLFLIDDTKDADSTNTHGKDDSSATKPLTATKNIPSLPVSVDASKAKALGELRKIKSIDTVQLLLGALKEFKNTTKEGADIVDAPTIDKFVELNTIEVIRSFYSFVK
jgi:hypothetical protein